ncbi:DUF3168 domain-containing protein [Pseudogemmobacter sonorensis]|uniref:DUF3168 domain-containing protein n=1 Tax=Pseudogemmobacter sonorensis TaxID=2989681 RepID=UPI0036AA933D
MAEPSLALQAMLRARMVASGVVTSLVPAAHILDRNTRPEVFPCILIGEAQTLPGPGLMRTRHEVFADLHIWAEEPGLATAKLIAGTIRDALRDRPWTVTGFHVADAYVQSTRFLRDPSGVSHGVMTLRADMMEVA